MANWSQHHDLVYAFVCVSFLADGEVDESEWKTTFCLTFNAEKRL